MGSYVLVEKEQNSTACYRLVVFDFEYNNDSLMGQIKKMLVRITKYTLKCTYRKGQDFTTNLCSMLCTNGNG